MYSLWLFAAYFNTIKTDASFTIKPCQKRIFSFAQIIS